MAKIHKTSSDELASLAAKVLQDEDSSKRAKSLAGSVLSQHEYVHNKEKKEE
jgi:hypothetical protein